MPSMELQRCNSIASGWDRRSFPVFFLYSVKATSRTDPGCEEEEGAPEGKDMVWLTGDDSVGQGRRGNTVVSHAEARIQPL